MCINNSINNKKNKENKTMNKEDVNENSKKTEDENNLVALKDIDKNGKDRKWRERKLSNLDLSDSYFRISGKYVNAKTKEDKDNFNNFYSKSMRVNSCSTALEFTVTTENHLKLTAAKFCHVRLCPICAWRRSLKIFGQVSKVMDYVEENYNLKYIFLTLTVRNCKAEELKDTLDLMMKAFRRLYDRKAFKKSIKGYFRGLEVTYNRQEDTYHPHFHVVLAVRPYYFTHSDYYISQEEWTQLWKSCLKIDYKPRVDVRKVKKDYRDLGKVVAEVAKYTVKPRDLLIRDKNKEIIEDITDKVVETLDKALQYKRLTAFGFLFKDIHKQLNLDDQENGDLINTDNEDIREDLTDIILRYGWFVGYKNYYLKRILSTEDKKEEEPNIVYRDENKFFGIKKERPFS